jgi:poly-gamma-glutamate synthesis protein (capsule biosynthesis protein)
LAAFLTRWFEYPGSEADRFDDDEDSIFEPEIEALAAAGVTQGCGERRFCPDDPVRRDHMASFLRRALGLTPIVPPERPAITLAFTGDTLIHMPVTARAALEGDRSGERYDFRPMFGGVDDIVAGADLAICHLEVPLSPASTDLSGYPAFNAPREVADALAAAGYDGCSTASNHSLDQGVEGIEATLAVLASVGLGQAGMAATPDRPTTTYQVGEVTVAHLSATWWLNGLELPEGREWMVDMLVVDDILVEAAAARAEGADVVVVSTHCCVEYQTRPTSHQEDVYRALVSSPDVDLVVGTHPHVVSPIERVGEEYVLYSLGNFLSGQRWLPETTDGVIVLVDQALRGDRWSTRGVEVVPTWVEGGTYRVKLAADANPASWRRTAAAITLYGADGVVAVR